MLESLKMSYILPISHLLLSIILNNPKTYKEFVILMYLSVSLLTIHLPSGAGILIIAASLFFVIKIDYFMDQSEIKYFLKWVINNKSRIFITLIIIISIPLFYISSSFIYKDFFIEQQHRELNYENIKADVVSFLKNFYDGTIKMLSLRYPDVNRIDDHKLGFFISVFGIGSFSFLILMYKLKNLKNYRI